MSAEMKTLHKPKIYDTLKVPNVRRVLYHPKHEAPCCWIDAAQLAITDLLLWIFHKSATIVSYHAN